MRRARGRLGSVGEPAWRPPRYGDGDAERAALGTGASAASRDHRAIARRLGMSRVKRWPVTSPGAGRRRTRARAQGSQPSGAGARRPGPRAADLNQRHLAIDVVLLRLCAQPRRVTVALDGKTGGRAGLRERRRRARVARPSRLLRGAISTHSIGIAAVEVLRLGAGLGGDVRQDQLSGPAWRPRPKMLALALAKSGV